MAGGAQPFNPIGGLQVVDGAASLVVLNLTVRVDVEGVPVVVHDEGCFGGVEQVQAVDHALHRLEQGPHPLVRVGLAGLPGELEGVRHPPVTVGPGSFACAQGDHLAVSPVAEPLIVPILHPLYFVGELLVR